MQYSQENICVWVCNFNKKRLQHRCFPVNITNFKNIYFEEHLRTAASVGLLTIVAKFSFLHVCKGPGHAIDTGMKFVPDTKYNKRIITMSKNLIVTPRQHLIMFHSFIHFLPDMEPSWCRYPTKHNIHNSTEFKILKNY